MTKEQAKELLPIIQAFAEGEIIQYKNSNDEWTDIKENGRVSFMCSPLDYRIKPQQKYRPFETKEECWNEMLKHHPFGWIKDEYKYVHIVCVHKNKIEFSPDEDDNGTLFTSTMDFTSVYEQGGYTFADGTPFGIKEEE